MKIPAFELPFLVGTFILFVVCLVRFIYWLYSLSKIDRLRVKKNIFTRTSWKSAKEAFMEGLIHRKVYKQNPMLGYMHMSLAFGWFMLIVVGHIETAVYRRSLAVQFHEAVFFRYYNIYHQQWPFHEVFAFLMDFFLLLVLSGVLLAWIKRFYKRLFGMKRTTRLKWRDYIALTSLWLIFPLRLFAESITAGMYHNGSFLTQTFGNFLKHRLPLDLISDPVWLAYSVSLGVFMTMLPTSRYFHIPTEIFYIYLKNCGIKLKKVENGYARVQTFSCSRCGICIDSCQMNVAGIKNTQSVYVLKGLRNRTLTDPVLFNCLLCGRCEQVCPVSLDLNDLRIVKRIEKTQQYNSTYDFLKKEEVKETGVIYFAGCMTHLTPSIIKSMKQIFEASGTKYWFMDEQKAACCGRPLMQAGQRDAAMKLIEMNQQQILESGAHTLVLSCPICYKVFNEDYHLPHIRILHHSQFILEQIIEGKIVPQKIDQRLVYHDPCELGRGSHIYNQPRALLRKYGTLVPIKSEKQKSLCCGGSLSNLRITGDQRNIIRDAALDELDKGNPDYLVTACPLCKKTFAAANRLPVVDIAEVVAGSLVHASQPKQLKKETELA
ncbi:MAG TPA: (Fe-S)-binding protein [Prolixibacteraceae bacterium]|nr:(Fe-S)-binding protein [Prolixibacteraceae bacterium]HPS12631.1 (Fe-S)-binding protein [Prolixibacteraceae bacterium]